MRTNFSTVALEEIPPSDGKGWGSNDTPPVETVPATAEESISLEEEHILLNEANMHHSSAEQHLSEIGRIMELSEALEDLAVIADGIGEATPTEIALIENAGNMAVAGSDVDPSRVVPALESYVGGRIAMEGIRETAATIWANIQRFLKQVWGHIEEFFKKMLFTVPRMQKAVQILKAKITAIKKENRAHTGGTVFEVVMGTNLLCVNGKPLKTEKEMINAYGQLLITSKWVFNDYAESVVERGRIVVDAIEKFNVLSPQVSIDTLRTELKAWKPSSVPGAGGTDVKRYPGFATTMGTALMGNQSLACKYYNDNKADVSPLAALERQRHSQCELVPTQETVPQKPSERLEFATMSLAGMETLLDEVSTMLDVLSKYKFGTTAKNIEDVKNKIVAASEKAKKTIEFYEKPQEAGGDRNQFDDMKAMQDYRAVVNFNVAYTRWAQSPSMSMMRHSITVSKAMMSFVQKSLVEYV